MQIILNCERRYATRNSQRLSSAASVFCESAATTCLAERRCYERKAGTPTTKDGYARERSASTPVKRVAHERNIDVKVLATRRARTSCIGCLTKLCIEPNFSFVISNLFILYFLDKSQQLFDFWMFLV